jgi:hypothetical protein
MAPREYWKGSLKVTCPVDLPAELLSFSRSPRRARRRHNKLRRPNARAIVTIRAQM